MNKNVDKNMNLGQVYKNLSNLNLTVDDMDLPVSVRNYLKRVGIDHLQQILCMSEADFAKFSFAHRNCAYLMSWLAEESRKRQCAESAKERKSDEK